MMTSAPRILPRFLLVSALLAASSFAPPLAAQQEEERVEIRPGRVSGRPTPRFESLRNPDTNLRVGPGESYKILWVYHRRGMPVEVYDEYDVWRRVRAPDGETGWLHHTQLSLARTAFLLKETELRAAPDSVSPATARLEAGVTATLVECRADLCLLEAAGLQGWAPKAALWGLRPEEVF